MDNRVNDAPTRAMPVPATMLLAIRLGRGWSQERMADHLGLDTKTYRAIEFGAAPKSDDVAEAIAGWWARYERAAADGVRELPNVRT